jgi:hypothetical protein
MRHMALRYWKSKFARFVESYGVESLAMKLQIRPSAIYQWIRGSTAPRPIHAEIMKQLARERGSRLTMDEIYEHTRLVRAEDLKMVPALQGRPQRSTTATPQALPASQT